MNKLYMALHWGKGSTEYISPEYGTALVNSTDVDYSNNTRDCRSVTSHIHLLNGVLVAWKCKKQEVVTLHSTVPEITYLTLGAKNTVHLRNYAASLGYPCGAGAPTLEDNQGKIKYIQSSHIHGNTRNLATKIAWLNELYVVGILKLLYTRTYCNELIATQRPCAIGFYNPCFPSSLACDMIISPTPSTTRLCI
jgi:hypothetical protein